METYEDFVAGFMRSSGTSSEGLKTIAETIDPPNIKYRHDPVAWAKDHGLELWSKQREILQSVRDNPLTAVHSAHSTGKSYVSATLVNWWLDVHPRGEARVITTAPTSKQVDAILWYEIGRMHKNLGLYGRCNLREMYYGRQLVALGRRPPDHQESAFQGLHARYLLAILDEACHDDQTDVLTDEGWLRFSDLKGHERLLSMNPETHVAEYLAPTRLVKKWHEGDMYEYTPVKGGNFCVTPDHMMYYQTNKGHWHKKEIQDIAFVNNNRLLRTFYWNADDVDTFEIPGVNSRSPEYRQSLVVDADSWMSFLGWFLSEGSTSKYGVSISQRSERHLDEIEALCRKLGFNPRRYSGSVALSDSRVSAYLRESGRYQTERRVPGYAKRVSARQIRLLLDAYVKGDGYQKGKGQVIYTASQHMADDLQELILKTGVQSVVKRRYEDGAVTGQIEGRVITSTADGWVVTRPHEATMLKIHPSKMKKISYSGYVYCATVPPHHLLMTRRHGHVMWSGNCGIPKRLWDEASTLASNEYGRILVVGNPDGPSEFMNVCTKDSNWNVIHIGYKHTPNFTGEDVSPKLREMLISRRWVDERRGAWGPKSALFQAKCEGSFPSGGDPFSVINHEWAIQCKYLEHPQIPPREAGIDIGAGNDRTVIRERTDTVAGREETFLDADPMRTIGKLVEKINEWDLECVKIDSTGIGWAMAGRLKELSKKHNPTSKETSHSAEVVPVNFGAGPPPGFEKKFLNMRAYLWWQIGREMSRLGQWDLSNVDEDVIHELTSPRYEILDSHGKIKIEAKKEVIKRLGFSPDRAEALILAYYKARKQAHTAGWDAYRGGNLLSSAEPTDHLMIIDQ